MAGNGVGGMPAVHERSFRVRFYECDLYGHVNHANYLRYMQEAAFDASAAVGYDFDEYEAMGCFWLVRQTGITYLRPLRFGETVIVKTWVSDFRRATSRRLYEMRVAESGELAAEAYTDWVFLDRKSQRPMRIPPQMVAAFTPTAGLSPGEKRQRFPDFPPEPAGVFRMRRRARWSELDGAGHINNAAYLSFLEDCAMEMLSAGGWPAARMHAEGFGIVAREYRIQYLVLDGTDETALLALIPLLVERDDREVQWHAKHGLVLTVVEVVVMIGLQVVVMILGAISGGLGCIFTLLIPIFMLAILIVHVLCIVKGINGQRFLVPGVSEFADKF